VTFHFISVWGTRNCGFSERAGNPHNLCSCSNISHHNSGHQKQSHRWLNCPECYWIYFSLPENMRNKTKQALVEWPKGHLHGFTTAIQTRKKYEVEKKNVCFSLWLPGLFLSYCTVGLYSHKGLLAAAVRWKGLTHHHWIEDKPCLKPTALSSKLSKVC